MNIELVVVRDPDGPVAITVFVDGVEHSATDYTVDAGAGWTWEEWVESRDHNLANASPAAQALLASAYNRPPGSRYVDKSDHVDWLDGIPSSRS